MNEASRKTVVNATVGCNRGRLPMWVLYDKPSDHPHGVVARLHYSLPEPEPTAVWIAAANAEPIRNLLAMLGCSRVDHHPNDDPVIMETWIV